VEKTKVAIVGMGTVGTGVARLLLDHGDRTARHAGRTLWLEKVVVRDLARPRDIELPEGVLTDQLADVLDDPEIKVVAQLIGGLEPDRSIMLALLEAGKDVVTANKALLAEHGAELFDRARQLNRTIAFEASVAGGIPIIANISQCFSANQILSLQGILNGTSNFILSQMEQHGMDYAEAVALAQQLGYAEADPSMDVDGSDAAQKLAILAHLAFGARTHWREIPRLGIDCLQRSDLRYAEQLGYRLRLLATAKLTDSGLQLHIAPTLIPIGHPLAEVRGPYNAISVVGDAVGDLFFHGQGAGQMPTASAVVADMIDVATGRAAITFKNLELFSEQIPAVEMRSHRELLGRYFLRLQLQDEPGALSTVTAVMGRHQISIASVIQHPPQHPQGDQVPVIIMTHQASEAMAAAAVEQLEQLPTVRGDCLRLRVLEPLQPPTKWVDSGETE
jgi:homoserine dehydrogenase